MMVVLMATSCNIALEKHPLMAYQKQLIPYKKGQKVRFTNENGDTILFTTKVITEWVEDVWSVTRIQTECRKVNLQSESGESISLELGEPDDYGYYNEPGLRIRVNNIHFHLLFDCEGIFYPNTFDSLSINNRTYYKVVLQEIGDASTQLYYNKTYGILQVNQNGKSLLTLQK